MSDEKRENWLYTSSGRNHGKVEAQVREMAVKIAALGLQHVTIEVTSKETYDGRKRITALEAENARLRDDVDQLNSGIQNFKCSHCKELTGPFLPVNLMSRISSLESALKSCRAAMTYAHEDHGDQYYLNVLADIDAALETEDKDG